MRCPRCGQHNRDDAAFCADCGASLAENVACRGCARPIVVGQLFCDRCGERLSEIPGLEQTEASDGIATSFVHGRYRALRLLGVGAHKRVHLVHDSVLDRDVAFVLIKHDTSGPEAEERSRREARAMARLPVHPNIVTVHDAGEERGRPYVVQEFVDGGTLADLIARAGLSQPLDLEHGLRIALDISAALEHAHQHGIIHRDVKPENIWLTSDGRAKLGDFGLVATATETGGDDLTKLTADGMVVGTISYMAPEQALGDPVDCRADLYALGVTLYEIFTGRPPFAGDSVVAIVAQHVHTPPVAPEWHNRDLPEPLNDLILRLLEKSPQHRTQSAAAVHAALSEVARATHAVSDTDVHEANPLDALATGVFVGRESELDELCESVDRVAAGRGGVAMIAGATGIGKTCLVEQVKTYAQLRGALVLSGRCYSGEGAPPYWPWAQVIRAYATDHDSAALSASMGPGAAEIAHLVSEVRRRLPDLPPPPSLGGEQARFRLFDSVSTFLANASRTQPLVIILDDLQNADAGSLLLLEFLAQELHEHALLVIGAYRDDELAAEHALTRTTAELARVRSARRLTLHGLSPAETEKYIELATGAPAEDQLAVAVYAKCEGNPFYLTEIVRLIAERNRDARHTSRAAEVTLPSEVRDLIRRRLEPLPKATRNLLAIGAVIGRSFPVRLLREVAELPADDVLPMLDEASAAHVIEEVAPGEFQFFQAVVCETLREGLPTARRRVLHHSIGTAYARLVAGTVGTHLAEVAYHMLEAGPAGDPEQTWRYGTAAAEHAAERAAYEEAVRWYERTIAALDTMTADGTRRCDLLLALGDVHAHAGSRSKARETFDEAVALARHIESPERLAAATLGAGGSRPTFGAVDQQYVTMLEDTLASLTHERHDALRARLLARLALELYFGGEPERRSALIDEALSAARRANDPASMAYVLTAQYASRWGPGTMIERADIADEVLDIARRTGDRELACEAHSRRAVVRLEMADLASARDSADAHRRLAEELRNPAAIWQGMVWQATLAQLAGRFEESEKLADQALAYGRRLRLRDAESAFAMQGTWAKLELGRYDGLIETLQTAGQDLPVTGLADAGVAYISAELGRREDAAAAFVTATADRFAGYAHRYHLLPPMLGLADASAFLGDTGWAAELYALLLPYAGQIVVGGEGWFCFGAADRVLGVLATTLERWETAEFHLTAGIELNRRIGAEGWLVRTQFAHAQMLLRRAWPNDADRARGVLAESLDRARQLDMSLIAAHIDNELAGLGPSRAPVAVSVTADAGGPSPPASRPS
jgi:eukaryotic-like serine/threonine-protein kinase